MVTPFPLRLRLHSKAAHAAGCAFGCRRHRCTGRVFSHHDPSAHTVADPWPEPEDAPACGDTVKQKLQTLLQHTQADELFCTCDLYNQQDRLRSFEILATLKN